MNRLALWTLRLYPVQWRKRYGDEMEALLSDTGADLRVVSDLFRGGLRMQAKTWAFLKLALVLGLGGVVLGIGLGFLLPSVYMSKATMQITPARISENIAAADLSHGLNEQVQRMEIDVLSRTSLSSIINDPRLLLYTDELKTEPLDDVIEEMKRNIRVNFVALPGGLGKRASAFDIEFSYPDRFKTQAVVLALLSRLSSSHVQMGRHGAPFGAGAFGIDVLDSPNLPVLPDYPKRRTMEAVGAVAGLLLAIVWRFTWRRGFIARPFVFLSVGAACALAGCLLMNIGSIEDWLPQLYRSSATLSVDGASADQMAAIHAEILKPTSLAQMINDPRLLLYRNELKNQPLEAVIQKMKQHLNVQVWPFNNSPMMIISFQYPDRRKAQQAVFFLMGAVDESNARLFPGTHTVALPSPVVLDVLDTASLPLTPVKPNRYMIALAGGIAGVFLAAIIALVRRRWRPEIQLPLDVPGSAV